MLPFAPWLSWNHGLSDREAGVLQGLDKLPAELVYLSSERDETVARVVVDGVVLAVTWKRYGTSGSAITAVSKS